jgi:hypothetical protein
MMPRGAMPVNVGRGKHVVLNPADFMCGKPRRIEKISQRPLCRDDIILKELANFLYAYPEGVSLGRAIPVTATSHRAECRLENHFSAAI